MFQNDMGGFGRMNVNNAMPGIGMWGQNPNWFNAQVPVNYTHPFYGNPLNLGFTNPTTLGWTNTVPVGYGYPMAYGIGNQGFGTPYAMTGTNPFLGMFNNGVGINTPFMGQTGANPHQGGQVCTQQFTPGWNTPFGFQNGGVR